jgi:aryl-alcohol dehydrogenase-like predicted oxidoreductase
MKIQRREFLKRSALGVSAITLNPTFAPAAPTYYDPYETVSLGRTGIKFTRFCMGTGMSGGMHQSNHSRMGKEKLEALFHGAYDRGVRLYDLADLYGTHPFLVPALKGIPREQYGIITKIWWRKGGMPDDDRPDADVVINRFLKEIGTDYLDLVLLHCVESPTWPKELEKQMSIMAKLKQKGLIRAHGVSCHTLSALQACVTEPWVDSVHARINPYSMTMDDKPEKVAPVLKQIHDAGKGVVGMKIIGEGRLRDDSDKKDASAKYVLGLGCVDILNIGFEKTDEIDDFATRVRKVEKA